MKASKNKLDFEREFKPFGELYSLLSIETGEKTEYVFLYNKDGIIEEDLKYYKQDLTHIKGNLYKSDDGKIFEKEIKYKYSTRTAISELDFNIIFDREFQKRVDEPQKRDEPYFAKILLKELNENKNVFNDKKEYFLLRKATDYFIEYLENKKNGLLPQPINPKTDTIKYTTKHYVLAYLFECNAAGESFPIGNKKELERIGNKRMEMGKGNRFYKVFNEIINKDLNAENNLIEIGGEDWRKALIELSKAPEMVEEYLQNKQL